MTTTLRSKIQAELAWTWTDHIDTLPIVDSNRLRASVDMPDGNSDGQADAVWHASDQSLSAGQSVVYELDQLSQDLFGSFIEIPMDAVKAILVVNTTTSGDGYLLVGGAASNAWEEPFGTSGDQIVVPAGSPLLLANTQDGWLIPSGQTDLKIQAVDGTVTYDIAILGTLSTAQPSSSSS
jgi:hypothetical protein